MHSRGLDVSPVQVVEAESGRKVALKSQTMNTQYEQVQLKLAENLAVHKKYLVMITFKGKLTEDLRGLYMSSYVDQATQTKR